MHYYNYDLYKQITQPKLIFYVLESHGTFKRLIKSQIVALKQAGLSLNEIESQLHVKTSTIRALWKKYLLTGSVKNKRVTSRHKKLTPTDVRRLCRTVIKSPKLSVASLTSRLNNTVTASVCSKTVRRYSRTNKFCGRTAAKKLSISPNTRLARLK